MCPFMGISGVIDTLKERTLRKLAASITDVRRFCPDGTDILFEVLTVQCAF